MNFGNGIEGGAEVPTALNVGRITEIRHVQPGSHLNCQKYFCVIKFSVAVDEMEVFCNFVQFHSFNCKNHVICSAQYNGDP